MDIFEKHKVKIYNNIFLIFLDLDEIPEEIVKSYINDKNDENHIVQDFIGMNLKTELFWATSLSIMDSIDVLIDGALENDNFNTFSSNFK